MTSDRLGAILSLAGVLLLWSSAFAFIGASLEHYGPGQLALLRFLFASTTLGVWARLFGLRMPRRRHLPYFALMGLCGITAYHLLLNYGQRTVPAGAAAMLVNIAPIFMAILASLTLGERLGPSGWLGIGIGFIGAAIIARERNGGVEGALNPDALLILGAALAGAIYTIIQKRLLRDYGAVSLASWAIWIGCAGMLPWAADLPRQVVEAPLAATAVVAYLGVMPAAVANMLWARALRSLPASRAGSFLYLIPFLAVPFGYLLLDQAPTWQAIGGGVVAIAGVVVVNTRRRTVVPTGPPRL